MLFFIWAVHSQEPPYWSFAANSRYEDKGWSAVSERVNQRYIGTNHPITEARTCSRKFQTLLTEFVNKDKSMVGSSGVAENYTEIEQLLMDIHTKKQSFQVSVCIVNFMLIIHFCITCSSFSSVCFASMQEKKEDMTIEQLQKAKREEAEVNNLMAGAESYMKEQMKKKKRESKQEKDEEDEEDDTDVEDDAKKVKKAKKKHDRDDEEFDALALEMSFDEEEQQEEEEQKKHNKQQRSPKKKVEQVSDTDR